jgi:AraC-like DNA-binding protein
VSKDSVKSAFQNSVGLSYLVRYLAFRQVDIERFFGLLDMDPALAESSDTRVPFQTYMTIMDQASVFLSDTNFGLHMGEYLAPAHYGIIGYIMMNCRNIRESYERIDRYMKIIGSPLTRKVQLGLGSAKIMYIIPKNTPRISYHYFEYVLANAITMVRQLTGRDIKFREIGFAHPAPPSTTEHNRIFRSPVKFSRKYNYFISDLLINTLPVVQPNTQLLDNFENFAKEYLAEIEGENRTTSAVIKYILAHLDKKKPDLSLVAREMSMSVRSLQKRLKSEGVIFRQLLEQTRKNLAERYLHDDFSIDEIAYLLGYSEASVFCKAFKKWSGYTPGEYRSMSNTR